MRCLLDDLGYCNGTMPSHILHKLQQHGCIIRDVGARLACLQSRPVSHWKNVVHYEAQNITKVLYDCTTEQIFKIKLLFVFSPQNCIMCCSKEGWCNTVVDKICPDFFATCCRHHFQNEHIYTKKQWIWSDETLHISSLHCCIVFVKIHVKVDS